MGEEGLEWRIHALSQDVCDLRSDLFCPWDKRKLRAFDGRKVFCFILRLPQTPTRRHAARSGGKTHPAPLVAVACSQCPVLGKAARTFGKLQMRESPGIFGFRGASFMGVSLRKHSSLGCSGMTRCGLLPRKEAGCQHAKARRVSSSRSLAARLSWAEPCSHQAAIPLMPSVSQSRRWKQRATDCKNRDSRRYRAVFGHGGVNGIPRRAC